jgi:hypothetical protein
MSTEISIAATLLSEATTASLTRRRFSEYGAILAWTMPSEYGEDMVA